MVLIEDMDTLNRLQIFIHNTTVLLMSITPQKQSYLSRDIPEAIQWEREKQMAAFLRRVHVNNAKNPAFCVKRGDILLCFYTKVAFKLSIFELLFSSIFVCANAP